MPRSKLYSQAAALHIAERAGLDCFLTLDGKLVDALRNRHRIQPAVDVVKPSELLQRLDACEVGESGASASSE